MAVYTLGRTAFPRKSDAEKRIKEILHGTSLHQPLADADLRLILGVLARQPYADEIFKGGIAGITVTMNTADTGISSRGFQVVHVDGSFTPFSYVKALGADASGKGIDEACRYAVAESIVEFKRKAFQDTERVPCAETGTLAIFADCDVHHAEPWPFKKIVLAFVEQNGEPSVRRRLHGDFGSEFVYLKDAANFRTFHDRLAILAIVSRDVHHRLRSAQLRDVGAEDSDNGECASSDLTKEFGQFT
jgi:hypothetical protein